MGPSALDLSLGVTTDENAPIQLGAFVYGDISDVIGYRVGGWLVTGSGDSHGFLADAYLDFKAPRVYVAGGQKFVVFGPAGGVLVSPGIRGGELKLDLPGVDLQVVTGRTQFTPVSGAGPRFTPSQLFPEGTVRPKEDMTAARAEFRLATAAGLIPVKAGVNLLDTLSDTGWSGDLEFPIFSMASLFGEYARFRGVDAWAAGLSLRDLRKAFRTERPTTAVIFYRQIPSDYAPAVVGASQYFPAQRGLAGGLYHELSSRGEAKTAVGVFADKNDAILTFFRHQPLNY